MGLQIELSCAKLIDSFVPFNAGSRCKRKDPTSEEEYGLRIGSERLEVKTTSLHGVKPTGGKPVSGHAPWMVRPDMAR